MVVRDHAFMVTTSNTGSGAADSRDHRTGPEKVVYLLFGLENL